VPLREGESHDGIRVKRIYRHKVEILDQGQFRVLYPETLPQVRRSQ
jgi:MSHA biogenesis protein MshK